MAGEPVVTIVGNLTRDPELRFTSSGVAVADFSVAMTPRSFDRSANEWRDGDTQFYRCSVWRDAAENVTETLRKGMRVIVQGRLTLRSYETRDGQQRSELSLQVDEVGPSLRYAKAEVTRTPRGDSGQGGYSQGGYQSQSGAGAQGGSGSYQGGYSQGGGQQGGYGQQQGSYNAPAGGSTSDPWRTEGASSFGEEPPF